MYDVWQDDGCVHPCMNDNNENYRFLCLIIIMYSRFHEDKFIIHVSDTTYLSVILTRCDQQNIFYVNTARLSTYIKYLKNQVRILNVL